MKNKHLITLVALWVLCSSCYSFKIYPKEYRKLKNEHTRPNAYVINDTLKEELKILKFSELFNIVNDSSSAELKIKLYPLEQTLVCGQPFIISMLTLGQLPVYLHDMYLYKFDEIEKGMATQRELDLKIAQRVWFWDLFVFNKRFEENAGNAVLGEYQQNSK
jgi:hypothetical protein